MFSSNFLLEGIDSESDLAFFIMKKYFDKKVHYRQNVVEATPYIIDVPPDIRGPHEYYEEPSANVQSKIE